MSIKASSCLRHKLSKQIKQCHKYRWPSVYTSSAFTNLANNRMKIFKKISRKFQKAKLEFSRQTALYSSIYIVLTTIYIVLGIISDPEMIESIQKKSMQEDACRLLENTTQFYTREQSIDRFWYSCRSWNPGPHSPVDTKRPLQLLFHISKHSTCEKTR